jgi:hypothetical protein
MAVVVGARTTPVETLGAKLRRLARSAEGRNAIERPPMVRPPAWAASTAYTAGQAVQNGGRWYVCIAAGTSAASGGPATTDGSNAGDGTVTWTCLGPAEVAADDPQAPAYSLATANPIGNLPQKWAPGTSAAQFRVLGGTPSVVNTDGIEAVVFQNSPATSAKGRGASISWVTDAQKLAIMTYSNGPGSVFLIDGQYYSLSASKVTSGTHWHFLDFGSFGLRKPRTFRLMQGQSGLSCGGVLVGNGDMLWAPPAPEIRAVLMGDSLDHGSPFGPYVGGRHQAFIMGEMLGWEVFNFAETATGFLAKGGGSVMYTYRERLPGAVALNPDILVFYGSRNDYQVGKTTSEVTAEALLTLQTARALGFKGLIIVFGNTATAITTPSPEATTAAAYEAALLAGFTQFADPLRLSFFLPVQADPTPWLTGSWTSAFRAGGANWPNYIGGDGIHFVDMGTLYNARRRVNAIRKSVLPLLA